MTRTRTTLLGFLTKGREFLFSGRRYVVTANLGPSGVSVRPYVTRTVCIGDREFESHASRSEVWSAGSPVEIEVGHKETAS